MATLRQRLKAVWTFTRHVLSIRGLLDWIGWKQPVGAALVAAAVWIWGYLKHLPPALWAILVVCSGTAVIVVWRALTIQPPSSTQPVSPRADAAKLRGSEPSRDESLSNVLEALQQNSLRNRPDVTVEVSDETNTFLVKNSGSSVAVDISAGNVRVPIPGVPSEAYKQEAARLGKNIQSELVITFGHVQALASSEGAVQLPFRVEGWSSLTDLYMLMEIVATPWPSLTPPRKKDAPPWSRTEDENRRSRIGRAIQIQKGVESSECELPLVLCFSNTGPPKRTWHSHHRLTYSVATKKLLCHHDSTDEVRDGVCPYCSSSVGRDKGIDPRLAAPHPDLMLELVGDTTTGTVSLYNRREIEAFNISITELSGEQGVIHWKHPSRLPGKTGVGVKFVIRNLGEESDRNTSIEHDAALMIALILHKVYPAEILEEQVEQVFRPVERNVFVKYLDITTKTNWQTLCRFIYSRKSGKLEIESEDAVPVQGESRLPPV